MMEQKKKIMVHFMHDSAAPALLCGLFCTLLATATLFHCRSFSVKMMFLLGLLCLVFGAVKLRAAIRTDQSLATVLGSVYFVVFGAIMLLANIGGVIFSSRVLGTMLFLYGAVRVTCAVFEKSGDVGTLVNGCVQIAMGSCLVLFAGENGILAALAVLGTGIQLLLQHAHALHIFRLDGDAKDILVGRR